MRENNNETGWKFWLGLVVGVAAGLYLNSEPGRRFRQGTGERLNQWSDELNDRTQSKVDDFSQRANQGIDKSKEYAAHAKENLKEKVEKVSKVAEELIDQTEENYQKAADWASSKLENGKEEK